MTPRETEKLKNTLKISKNQDKEAVIDELERINDGVKEIQQTFKNDKTKAEQVAKLEKISQNIESVRNVLDENKQIKIEQNFKFPDSFELPKEIRIPSLEEFTFPPLQKVEVTNIKELQKVEVVNQPIFPEVKIPKPFKEISIKEPAWLKLDSIIESIKRLFLNLGERIFKVEVANPQKEITLIDKNGKPIDWVELFKLQRQFGGAGWNNARLIIDIASAIGNGVKTVTTAGTAVQLSTTSRPCKEVTLQAPMANTGAVAVGSSTVNATTGSGSLLYAGGSITLKIDNLNKLWLDSTVNGEGVGYSYLE